MTCDELLAIARRDRPGVTYTRNRQGTAIAAWQNGRWNTVAGLGINGLWFELGDLFIDGEPCNRAEDWVPVENPQEPQEVARGN